jgi:hypothetical protein
MKLGLVIVLSLLVATASERASACAICFGGMRITVAQQLAATDRAALVVAARDGTSVEIVETIKGGGTRGDVLGAAEHGIEPRLLAAPGPLLIVRNDLTRQWTSVGTVSIERADFLRRVASGAPGESASEAQWRAYVAYLLPYLDDRESLVEKTAHAEFERAPYSALRSLKPRLNVAKYRAALDDPHVQSLYTLLYGIAGSPADAGPIERRIDAAWTAKAASNLSALLAADLELRGASRVAWIEKMYFENRDRTLAEIEAALLALSVQGSANAAVPRERVIAAYRSFIKERKPMAALVTQDLAAWKYWDAAPEYVVLLKSDALADPASRVAVLAYLMRNPRADAKAAVRSITSPSR